MKREAGWAIRHTEHTGQFESSVASFPCVASLATGVALAIAKLTLEASVPLAW